MFEEVCKETGSYIELLDHRISSGDVKITHDFMYFFLLMLSAGGFFPEG